MGHLCHLIKLLNYGAELIHCRDPSKKRLYSTSVCFLFADCMFESFVGSHAHNLGHQQSCSTSGSIGCNLRLRAHEIHTICGVSRSVQQGDAITERKQ